MIGRLSSTAQQKHKCKVHSSSNTNTNTKTGTNTNTHCPLHSFQFAWLEDCPLQLNTNTNGNTAEKLQIQLYISLFELIVIDHTLSNPYTAKGRDVKPNRSRLQLMYSWVRLVPPPLYGTETAKKKQILCWAEPLRPNFFCKMQLHILLDERQQNISTEKMQWKRTIASQQVKAS